MAERSADERLPLQSLAAREAVIERLVDSADLPRFRKFCEPGGSVRTRLSFGSGDDGGIRIRGTLSVPVRIDCHRCLEAVPVELSTDFAVVAAMHGDDAARLGAVSDVLTLSTGEPTLAEVIEDELILALPQRPCARRNCEKAPPFDYPPETGRRDHPFGSLAEWKRNE